MIKYNLSQDTLKVQFTFDSIDSSGNSCSSFTAGGGVHGLGVYLPKGTIVTNAYYRIVPDMNAAVNFASSTDSATVALHIQSAGDLKAGIAISDASNVWDAGVHGCLPGSYSLDGNSSTAIVQAASKAASYILLTAQRELTVTVGVQNLTAGAMFIYIEYVS